MRNVVLLTVDALRADHCSCYDYDRKTTPFLDSLADAGVRVIDAFSASSHTREAIPAMLSGQYPHRAVGADFRLAADSLPELLPSEYRTGAFHSNPFLSRAYGFDAGFDAFDDDLFLGNRRYLALAQRLFDKLRDRHYAPAETINSRATSWLDGLDGGPFFLWNHYMDPHGPYHPPADYADTFGPTTDGARAAKQLYHRATSRPNEISDAERRELIDSYDAEIRYLDDCLADFIDTLESMGLREETLVIVTADHGDAFGEEGRFGHPRHLLDALVCVPMVLDGPTVPPTEVAGPASLLDVAPTILEVAGVSTADAFPGTALQRQWHESSGECGPVLSEVRDGQTWRFRADDGRQTVHYECRGPTLDERAGPAGETELAATLREHLRGIRGVDDDRTVTDDVPSSVKGRLDALGYR